MVDIRPRIGFTSGQWLFFGSAGVAFAVELGLFMLGFTVLGVLIARREPHNAVGWLFCAVPIGCRLSRLARWTSGLMLCHAGQYVAFAVPHHRLGHRPAGQGGHQRRHGRQPRHQ